MCTDSFTRVYDVSGLPQALCVFVQPTCFSFGEMSVADPILLCFQFLGMIMHIWENIKYTWNAIVARKVVELRPELSNRTEL